MPDVTSTLRSAGYNDDEIAAWATSKRDQLKAGGFSDDEVDDYLGIPKTPKQVPRALIERVMRAGDVAKNVLAMPNVVPEMVDTTLDAIKNTANLLLPKQFGGGRDEPAKEGLIAGQLKTGEGLLSLMSLPFAPLQGALRAFAGQPLVAAEHALREGAVKIHGEDAVAAAEKAMGLEPGGMTYEDAKGYVDTAMMLVGAKGGFRRIGVGPTGAPEVLPVGGLPKGTDFSDAATVLGHGDPMPHVEAKLADLYEQKGIHPAEVAHDAQHDPVITQKMLSADPADVPPSYGEPPKPPSEPPKGYNGPFFHGTIGDLEGGAFSLAKASKDEPAIFLSDREEQARNFAFRKDLDTPEQQQALLDSLPPLPKGIDPHIWRQMRDQQIEEALRAGGKIITAYLKDDAKIKNIDWMDVAPKPEYFSDVMSDQIHKAKAEGYDAIKISNMADQGTGTTLAVINPDVLQVAHGGGVGKGPPGPPPSSLPASAPPPPPYSDAEKQILSKISIGEKAPQRALTWDGMYTNFLDKLFPIGKAVKESGLDLPTENNPYQLARLMTGYVGKADHFLNNATFDFKTFENNGPSLKEILKPVADDLNGFRAYATASRAIELEGRGIKSGFADGAAAPPLVSEGLEAARTVVKEGAGKYEKPFRALVDYQNRVSAYLRDSGVLSDAGYKAMLEANKMFVPFHRVMGLDETAAARGGSSLQARNPIRSIKGSGRDIIDPIESIVRNTYHLLEMSERNVIGTKLVDMLTAASEGMPDAPPAVATEAKPLPRSAAAAEALGEVGIKKPADLADALAHASEPTKQGEIAILRDGKRETYEVDPDLARAMKGLDQQSMGLLERVIAYPASILRAGAVTTPDFALRHTIRDFLYAATTFEGGVFHPVDMAKGFLGLIMKDADYWNWLKGGGGNVSFVGMDRQYLQQDIRKLTGQTGLVGRAWNVLANPEASMWEKTTAVPKLPFQAISKFVLDPLRTLTQFAESASHLAAFKKSSRLLEQDPIDLRSQLLRSAWVSRDTAVDAMRMGASMRAYNMITAFANIKLQDTDRVVRAIKDNPIGTLTKIGGAITVPSVILWGLNHDDPDYQEIAQWQKDMFWLIPVGSEAPSPLHVEQAKQRGEQPKPSAKFFMRVPKPWAMGMIFGSLPERLLDAYAAEKPDAFKGFFDSLYRTSGPEFIPTAAAPIIDQFANRSTFTNRTLIPSAQEKFLPEYQYTPYTTELTKQLGKTIGAFPGMSELKMENSGWGGTAKALTSPILMENYIRGWTGTLGNYALQAADTALRKTGALPDPPLPTSTLADIPIIRAFVVRYPTATTESVQNFYDNYEKNAKYFDTYIAKARDGDAAAMNHIAEMGGPLMFARLDGIKSTLSEHSQLIRDIYKNDSIPRDEKRQLIDTLYFNMIQVSRYGNEAVRQMQMQSLGKTMH